MKFRKIILLVIAVSICFCLIACTPKEEKVDSNNSATDSVTSKITEPQTTVEATTINSTENTAKTTESTVEEITEVENQINLTNEYMTRFGEINAITYPKFIFNYPDNWEVVREDVTQISEIVTLENGSGATVTFLYNSGSIESGGSSVNMARVDITKEAPSQFVPGSVQATDYSDLGEFMVAKLKTTGILNMKTDSEYTDVDGDVSYAVLPLSEQGTRENIRKATSGEFTFWYAGTVSFTGSDSEDNFTDEEQQEIIAILNSFRVEQY